MINTHTWVYDELQCFDRIKKKGGKHMSEQDWEMLQEMYCNCTDEEIEDELENVDD